MTGKSSPSSRKTARRGVLVIFVFLLFLLFPQELVRLVSIPLGVLPRVARQVSMPGAVRNLAVLMTVVACLVLVERVWLVRRRGVMPLKPAWRAASILAGFFLCALSAVLMVGMVHQAGWLLRPGRETRSFVSEPKILLRRLEPVKDWLQAEHWNPDSASTPHGLAQARERMDRFRQNAAVFLPQEAAVTNRAGLVVGYFFWFGRLHPQIHDTGGSFSLPAGAYFTPGDQEVVDREGLPGLLRRIPSTRREALLEP